MSIFSTLDSLSVHVLLALLLESWRLGLFHTLESSPTGSNTNFCCNMNLQTIIANILTGITGLLLQQPWLLPIIFFPMWSFPSEGEIHGSASLTEWCCCEWHIASVMMGQIPDKGELFSLDSMCSSQSDSGPVFPLPFFHCGWYSAHCFSFTRVALLVPVQFLPLQEFCWKLLEGRECWSWQF